MTLEFRVLTGDELDPHLDGLANLRIQVFRDWPYLYDGDLEYERDYMSSYRDSADAILVAAFDGETLVGASTGTPMEDHAEDFALPFGLAGIALGDVFYCAESVLLSDYRGQGAGHAFFDARERHARALGRRYAAFCGVMRPDDHPMRDPNYRPLDGFWRGRGYSKLDGAIAEFSWRDVGADDQTAKSLQFWIKEL